MSEQLPPPTGAPVEPATMANRTPKIILWAFIASLFGILIIPAIAAVIMVAVGWKQVKATGKGKGLAIAAIVISALWVIFVGIAAVNAPDEATQPAATETVEVTEEAVEKEAVAEEAPEPTPDNNLADETVGYKLAVIDGEFSRSSVEQYERRIAQVAERCQEPESSAGDKVVKATQILDERGITENNLWVMDSILQAIPPNEAGTFDCAEVIALLITLRVNE